jgi:hypothetical protein
VSQPLVEMRTDLLERRDRPVWTGLEYERSSDVHVSALVLLLELEKRRVEWCQAISHVARLLGLRQPAMLQHIPGVADPHAYFSVILIST